MAKLIELAQNYENSRGLTHKLVMGFADVAALTSGTAYSVFPTSARVLPTAAAGATLPVGTIVKQFYSRVTTAFASVANTITLVEIVGDGGDTARYQASTTLKTVAYRIPTLKMPFLYTVADTVDVIYTAGVEAITLLTAGEVEYYFELFDPKDLNNPRSSVG